MNIKTLSICLITLLSFNVFAAERLTVYRWIDKENVVHFSQNQPAHDDYIEIDMANNKKSSNIISNMAKTEPSQLEEKNLADSGEEDDLSNEKCLVARDNIKTLENFDNIKYKDAKGNVKVLSALEIKQQLAMNTKQAEIYCTD